MAARRKLGPVEAAVKKELTALRKRDPDLADGALAASALAMAQSIDGPDSSTSRSMCSRELRDTLSAIRELAPKQRERTKRDELSARRANRLEGGAKAATRKRS
jgi:hypothetical protein